MLFSNIFYIFAQKIFYMEPYSNHGNFICDRCREICKGGCFEQLKAVLDGEVKEGSEEYEKAKDLIGRKQIIHCLGKYCDTPCKLNREEYTPFEEDDELTPLFNLIEWMGNRLHELIKENNELKKKIKDE